VLPLEQDEYPLNVMARESASEPSPARVAA
jgi:hypothetical protein